MTIYSRWGIECLATTPQRVNILHNSCMSGFISSWMFLYKDVWETTEIVGADVKFESVEKIYKINGWKTNESYIMSKSLYWCRR